MPWTLNDALQECARNTYNMKQIVRNASGYSGKGLDYVNRLLSGINYAINKVCREKVGILRIQTVTLDQYGRFDTSTLDHLCVRISEITYGDEREKLAFTVELDESVTIESKQDVEVRVIYESIPTSDLTIADLDTPLPIDQRYVDPRVLCQYANYQFLSEEGTTYDSARAQAWLGLFNDSFSHITPINRLPRRVSVTR